MNVELSGVSLLPVQSYLEHVAKALLATSKLLLMAGSQTFVKLPPLVKLEDSTGVPPGTWMA